MTSLSNLDETIADLGIATLRVRRAAKALREARDAYADTMVALRRARHAYAEDRADASTVIAASRPRRLAFRRLTDVELEATAAQENLHGAARSALTAHGSRWKLTDVLAPVVT